MHVFKVYLHSLFKITIFYSFSKPVTRNHAQDLNTVTHSHKPNMIDIKN